VRWRTGGSHRPARTGLLERRCERARLAAGPEGAAPTQREFAAPLDGVSAHDPPWSCSTEYRHFSEAARGEHVIARRDAALLALLTGAGLRRSELAGLQPEDLDLESGQVIVRRGKGRKDRITWLPPSGLPAIQDWLHVRGDEPGPLLCPVGKGGQLQQRAMSSQAIRGVCRRRARLAALSPFSPHDCRRTWAGDLLDAGADLATTQGLAGHASPSTTAQYDRRPEAVRRRAASLCTCLTLPRFRAVVELGIAGQPVD
jgi:integrase